MLAPQISSDLRHTARSDGGSAWGGGRGETRRSWVKPPWAGCPARARAMSFQQLEHTETPRRP